MAQLKRISIVSLIALGMAMPAFAQQTGEGGPQAPQPAAGKERDNERNVVVVTSSKR